MDDRLLESTRFLELVYADKADTDYVNLFCIHPEKKQTASFFFRDLDELAAKAQVMSDAGWNVYVGIGVGYKAFEGGRRYKKEDVIAMTGLYLDLDIRTEHHKKQNLFENIDAARAFLTEVKFEPTLLIGSGGGLQPHFFTERMTRFTAEGDREKFDELSMGFARKMVLEAHARYNVNIDVVGDISRVLRLPGTINHNYPHKPIVTILEHNPSALIKLGDVAGYVSMASAHVDARKTRGGHGHTLNQSATVEEATTATAPTSTELPQTIQNLLELEPAFRQVFERKPGILNGKSSDSEFDLSIASRCTTAGIPDADIVAAIRWSRKFFALAPEKAAKGWRGDYVERTVAKAKTGRNLMEEPENVEAVLQNLGLMLGLDIRGVWKYEGDPPKIQIEIQVDGEKKLVGTVTPERLTWRGLNDRIYGTINKDIRKMKPEEFDAVRSMLGAVMTVAQIGDADPIEWTKAKVKEYMHAAKEVDHTAEQAPWAANSVAKKLKFEGHTWLRLEDFESWLFHQNPQTRMPEKQEWGRLFRASLGMDGQQIPMQREDGKVSRQWFWQIPRTMED